mgnify:CR=1 FL=1
MTKKAKEQKWYLIHTDNGEWISDDNVVILTKEEVEELKKKSLSKGVEISVIGIFAPTNFRN